MSPSQGEDRESETTAGKPRQAPQSDEFEWQGWVLVGVVVVSFLVIPASILYVQQAQWVLEATGLSLRQAFIALPMIPAILLGGTAIWAAVQSRSPNK